ncbi:MAG: DUF1570 domain-containing protein [Planctomycetota bacterium]
MSPIKIILFSLMLSASWVVIPGEFPVVPKVNAQTSQPEMTIKLTYKSKEYFGRPLAWDGKDLMLLRTDGQISTLPAKNESDFQKIKTGFDPLSAQKLRNQLQKEYGSKYQVSVTQNFVVVHPPGSYTVWAQPFEELYSRFRAYFSTRGLRLKSPEFPMVAIVLRTRREFDRFLVAYHKYDSNILGYYNPQSNRIITYNQSNSRSTGKNWFFNSSTIIHEATHQTAFNVGLHSRFTPVPRWISEGLAMLFEAPGINNSHYHSRQSDRINRGRLLEIKHFYQKGKIRGKLANLIINDDLFRSEPEVAYAMSWALTFYLHEKKPQAYLRFLAADGARQDFATFTSKQRATAFAKAFGSDIRSLEARMAEFYSKLKVPSDKIAAK